MQPVSNQLKQYNTRTWLTLRTKIFFWDHQKSTSLIAKTCLYSKSIDMWITVTSPVRLKLPVGRCISLLDIQGPLTLFWFYNRTLLTSCKPFQVCQYLSYGSCSWTFLQLRLEVIVYHPLPSILKYKLKFIALLRW